MVSPPQSSMVVKHICLFHWLLQMLQNTIIEKHKKKSQTAVVSEDTEKLENAAYVFLS